MTSLINLDLNGRGCGYLYRKLPEGGILSLGEIIPPVQYGGKYVANYRGLRSEHNSRALALESIEQLERARDRMGYPVGVFHYTPTQTWLAEQYLSGVPADIATIAVHGGIMAWASAECDFSDATIQGGATALAAVAAKQMQAEVDALTLTDPLGTLVQVGSRLISDYQANTSH